MPLNKYNILCWVQTLSMSKVKLDVTRVVLIFPVPGVLCPDPLLDLPALSHQAGGHHLKLQFRHQPWYGHSLAGLSKVSQTLLVG